jgi:hypothetical protein
MAAMTGQREARPELVAAVDPPLVAIGLTSQLAARGRTSGTGAAAPRGCRPAVGGPFRRAAAINLAEACQPPLRVKKVVWVGPATAG